VERIEGLLGLISALALPVAITFLKFSFHVRSQLPTEPEKIEFKKSLQEASSARNSPDLITLELSEATSNERPLSLFHVILNLF